MAVSRHFSYVRGNKQIDFASVQAFDYERRPMEIGSPTGGSVQEEATGAKPVEDVLREDPKPEGEAAGGEEPPKMPSSESLLDEDMDLTLLYKRLLRGDPEVKRGGAIKKVRIEGENIRRLLEVRPRDKPMPKLPPFPEDYDQLPFEIQSAFIQCMNDVRESFEYEQYIIDQYFDKGYAEVYAYVTDEGTTITTGNITALGGTSTPESSGSRDP
ncbi:hypothetical protein ACP70R_015948 [Stipagrostis hirtigluma subsp. patula]